MDNGNKAELFVWITLLEFSNKKNTIKLMKDYKLPKY